MSIKNYFKALAAIAFVCIVSGCVTTGKSNLPKPPKSADLDRACAELIVQFMTSRNWNEFATEYANKVKANRPAAENNDEIPLMFISQINNNLRTLAGNPVNYSNITDSFTHYLMNADKLDRFVRRELMVKYPELYDELKKGMAALANVDEWEWQGPEPTARIRLSKATGIEMDKAVENIDYIYNDPRFEQKIQYGKLQIPGLALSFRMEPYDETRFKFTAYIIDYLSIDGTSGEGIVRWDAFVLINR